MPPWNVELNLADRTARPSCDIVLLGINAGLEDSIVLDLCRPPGWFGLRWPRIRFLLDHLLWSRGYVRQVYSSLTPREPPKAATVGRIFSHATGVVVALAVTGAG